MSASKKSSQTKVGYIMPPLLTGTGSDKNWIITTS